MLIAVGTGSGNGSGSVGPHSHVAADVTDFNEAVDDRVAALLQAGSNVSLDYDDASGTLTVASTGGGLFTGVSDKAADYTAAGTDDKTLLNFTSAATLTLPPAASLPDGWTIGVRNVSGGSVVLQPSGSETVNDAASLLLASGRGVLLTKIAGGFVTLDGSALSPVAFVEPPVAYGYLAGDDVNAAGYTRIERFALASSANASTVGNLSKATAYAAGVSDVQGGYGYVCGGKNDGATVHSTVERFLQASSANGVQVGDLTVARLLCNAVPDGNGYGHVAGGSTSTAHPQYYSGATSVIDRLPLASSATAADVGDLTIARLGASGAPDFANQFGYWQGGQPSTGVNIGVIDRCAFATSANATSVGDLSLDRGFSGGHHDSSNGFAYASGGWLTPGNMSSRIDRFAFSSSANATAVGDLTAIREPVGGNASDSTTGYGYAAGGYQSATTSNVIDRFAFSSSGNAADVGDMTAARCVCGMEGN